MKQKKTLAHEFVEFIPDAVEEGKLYVSIEYATVVHKCCCGCGKEVVTPLSPTDWKLIFDGKTISLHPSIGNWSFPCRSHYWIRNNRVQWAEQLSQKEIEAGRSYDRSAKRKYFDGTKTSTVHDADSGTGKPGEDKSKQQLWRKLKSWWS